MLTQAKCTGGLAIPTLEDLRIIRCMGEAHAHIQMVMSTRVIGRVAKGMVRGSCAQSPRPKGPLTKGNGVTTSPADHLRMPVNFGDVKKYTFWRNDAFRLLNRQQKMLPGIPICLFQILGKS